MYELPHVLLEAETTLPLEIVGPGVLLLSLLVTLAWLVYVYR